MAEEIRVSSGSFVPGFGMKRCNTRIFGKYCHTMLIAHGYWCDKKATRKRRKRMFAIYRVAASIVVVLGVSAMLWMRKDKPVEIEIADVATITPGRPVAKLTVASGMVYHLDSLNQVSDFLL